jgi:hypothetical protein
LLLLPPPLLLLPPPLLLLPPPPLLLLPLLLPLHYATSTTHAPAFVPE